MSSRPRRVQYQRVSETPSEDDVQSQVSGSKTTRAKARAVRSQRAEEYAVKMHAALWVLAAGFTGWYSDFINVARSGEKLNQISFSIGLFFFIVAACLILYMAVFVPRVLKSDVEPSVYSPQMLPVTGGISLLSGLFLIIGFWPAFGLLTPAVLGVLWLGALMSAHFLPAM
eukprot:CAMPEP_0171528700 /NCGR_PEP_ID=MMETSP0959-20130129/11844_1 /TAXON_ID=87120 /ORGANISM="Aurantiochytrium limacinum, Strain ATCCMYA-1381" /LENGTH=170 /DNA_ID=CAMNT_0012070763 /DNA_START=226 /DNA_END=738 /DNA_ORIENTATION=+